MWYKSIERKYILQCKVYQKHLLVVQTTEEPSEHEYSRSSLRFTYSYSRDSGLMKVNLPLRHIIILCYVLENSDPSQENDKNAFYNQSCKIFSISWKKFLAISKHVLYQELRQFSKNKNHPTIYKCISSTTSTAILKINFTISFLVSK